MGADSERLKRTASLKRHGNDWRVSASRRSRHASESSVLSRGGQAVRFERRIDKRIKILSQGNVLHPIDVEKRCVWGHERSEGMQLPPASGKWRGERLCLMVAKKCARWMSRPQKRSQLRPRPLLDKGGELHAGVLERVSY